MEQTLTLGPDGSGTVDMRYAVDLDAIAALTAPEGPGALPAFSAEDIRRDLAVYAPYGVRVLAAQVEERDGRRNIDIRLGFDDVRTLAHTTFFADNRLKLTREADDRWVLEQRLIPPRPGEMEIDLHPPDQQAHEGFPDGFRATFTVSAPAVILESNADEVAGRTARWLLGAGGKPEAIRFARGEAMRLVFDGEGLALPEPRRMSIRLPAPK